MSIFGKTFALLERCPFMSSRTTTPATLLARLTKALLALQDPECPIVAMTVDRVAYTNAEMQAKLGAVLAPFQAVVEAGQVYDNAVLARTAAMPRARDFTTVFYLALSAQLGADNAELATYGGRPRKVPPALTSEQKLAAVLKAKATRAARHTMGKRQKAAIHGTVPPAGPPEDG